MLNSTAVFETGTNFIPSEFTQGASLVAVGSPPPAGSDCATGTTAGSRGFVTGLVGIGDCVCAVSVRAVATGRKPGATVTAGAGGTGFAATCLSVDCGVVHNQIPMIIMTNAIPTTSPARAVSGVADAGATVRVASVAAVGTPVGTGVTTGGSGDAVSGGATVGAAAGVTSGTAGLVGGGVTGGNVAGSAGTGAGGIVGAVTLVDGGGSPPRTSRL